MFGRYFEIGIIFHQIRLVPLHSKIYQLKDKNFPIKILFLVFPTWHSTNKKKLNVQEELIRRAAGTPVLVTVYYEALCPDSKHFVVKQLQSTFERAPELIDVKLIPYGKATTIIQKDGSLKFECQHGQTECEANKIHACTIEIVEDFKNRLDLVSCMIRDNSNPKEALKRVSFFLIFFI